MKVKGLTANQLEVTNEKVLSHSELRFLDIRTTEELRVYGLYDYKNGESFVRLPEELAEKVSKGVAEANYHTTGARIRFITDSDYLAVRTYYPGLFPLTGNSFPTAFCGFDVYVNENGKDKFLGIITPFEGPMPTPISFESGISGILELPKGKKQITLNLPIRNRTNKIYIGLAENSLLEPAADYKFEKPVLYYGSSITQGFLASRPGMIYEAQISRRLDCNFMNLGFGGSCAAEPIMADYIASLDPSVFVYDYDHNASNSDYYRNTFEPLYLKFRAAHHDTPVIFVGRPDFWLKGYFNAVLPETNREVMFDTYKKAFERGENVYYIDGYSLLDGEDREECTSDLIHPNDLGFYRMSINIGKYVEIALNKAYSNK